MIAPDALLHAHRKILLETLNDPTPPTRTPAAQLPPPPAYTPSSPHTLTAEAMLDLTGEDDDDDYAVLPPPPPINIKIDATTKIVGHGNVLACSPAETATRVAGMLVAALRQAKVLGGGDEGMGRMRPVEISVSAGVNVVGCRNVVGAAGVKAKPKLVEEGKEGGIEGMEGGRKRKAEAESVEMPQTKRSNVGGEAEQNEKITPEGTK